MLLRQEFGDQSKNCERYKVKPCKKKLEVEDDGGNVMFPCRISLDALLAAGKPNCRSAPASSSCLGTTSTRNYRNAGSRGYAFEATYSRISLNVLPHDV